MNSIEKGEFITPLLNYFLDVFLFDFLFDLFCELPLEFWEVDFLLLKQPKRFVEDFALFERFVYRLNALRAPPFFV